MKLTGRKILGFLILILIFTTMFFFILFKNPELLETLGPNLFMWMFLSFLGLILSNTAIKWIVSKWFRKDLCENGDNEEN